MHLLTKVVGICNVQENGGQRSVFSLRSKKEELMIWYLEWWKFGLKDQKKNGTWIKKKITYSKEWQRKKQRNIRTMPNFLVGFTYVILSLALSRIQEFNFWSLPLW